MILRLWNWELLQHCDYTMSSSCATSLLLLSSCGVEEIVAKENGIETMPSFVFPELKNLTLHHLVPRNTYFGMAIVETT